jgi:putative SOS response-associated peptidase YedK
MCGRYTLTADVQVIQDTFQLDSVPPLQARYNIAPTQAVPIITGDKPRELTMVSWGLVPSWAKDTSGSAQLMNARGETIDEKPSFRTAFKRRRCLVPADGFYEWRKQGNGKAPQYIHFKDRRVFAFAGLWERWNSPHGDEVLTCTIITSEPNELIKPLHNRMAVILDAQDYATWLSKDTSPAELKHLLQPYPDNDDLDYHEVSPVVNGVSIDSPYLIEPFQSFNPPQQTSLF